MLFTQYYLECLSQASYLVADEATGRAVVIDPRRDVAEYLADARRHGLTIVGVVDTHFHADFLAGHLELAEATGAWIGFGEGAEADFPVRALADGERISLGDVTLQIMAAIIAHLLIRLAQLQSRSSLAAQAVFRLSCLTLFQRRPLYDLLSPPTQKAAPPCPQLTLAIPHG